MMQNNGKVCSQCSDFGNLISIVRSMLETSSYLLLRQSSDLDLSATLSLAAQEKMTELESAYNSVKFNTDAPAPTFGPFFYPTTSTIGDRIREMRKSAGISQRKLAEQISVTGVCILKWETNQTQPGCDKIIPLSNALNCDPMWLLTGEKADTQRAPE